MEKTKKTKILNFLWCTLLSVILGALCAFAFIYSGVQKAPAVESISLVVIYAIFWGVLIPNVCNYCLRDVIKTILISIFTLTILVWGFIPMISNEIIRLCLLLLFHLVIPILTAAIFGIISCKKARDNSSEMQLSQKATEWWIKHLNNAGINDEPTIKNFRRCLSNELYRDSLYNKSSVIATGCGILERLAKDLLIPKGILPEDVVMVISFKEKIIYYTNMSEKNYI